MRNPILAAAIVLLAVPANAQRIGARTSSPEAMLAGMNRDSPEDELRGLIAAADAHPLGTRENPVRVGGPAGERAYLSRLRCAGGAAPQAGPRGDSGVGAFGSVVGAYALDCGGTRTRILFDIYHEEHDENRAPPGFTILPR